ncbi:MAG: YitT family protein [Thermoguttaceae bacterium]|nr:YitT family protein [Thermoguttaceae bacterium]
MPKEKHKTLLKNTLKEKLGNLLMLFVAGIVNAFGVTIFLYPVKLYDSGISGLSMLLDQITPDHLSLSLFLIVFNIPIFILGLKKQGISFTLCSVFAVAVYSFASFMIMHVLPVDVSFISPLAGSDLLLCAVFGGVISGVGSGMTIRFGGAIDGVDVLSVIFARRIGISIGTFVMLFNTLLYIICGIAIQSWILPLYSIVTYYVGSRTVDFITEGFDRAKCAMIVTVEADRISDALSDNFSSSGTIVKAIGGYSKEEKEIVYFIVNRFQINKLKKIVHDIDNAAFISLQEVADIIRKRE